MIDEELALVQEELAEARAELERLQVNAADREAQAAHLESELAQARSEAEARDGELASAREQEQAFDEQVRASAARYRELALQQLPELPAELVAGDTVDEVEQSVQRARETVAKVRGHLESEAQAGRVPVGAPPRSEPDLSELSPEEKIRFGLQQGG